MHSFQWIIDKEATTTSSGSKHEECSVCHYKKEAVVIPAIGNSNMEKPGDNTSGSDTEDSSESKPSQADDNAPRTGDTGNLWLWILAISVTGMGATLANYKKRNYPEKGKK